MKEPIHRVPQSNPAEDDNGPDDNAAKNVVRVYGKQVEPDVHPYCLRGSGL